jgi:HEAT repeat protein
MSHIGWQAEELLNYVAGDDAPSETIGVGDVEARKKCTKAWRAWFTGFGQKLDLTKVEREGRRPRLVLLCGFARSGDRSKGRVCLVGCTGKVRWAIGRPSDILDAQLLGQNRLLLAGPSGAAEYSVDGRVLWEYASPIQGMRGTVRRLANGETLIFSIADCVATDFEGNRVYPAGRRVEEVPRYNWVSQLSTGRLLQLCDSPKNCVVEFDPCEERVIRKTTIRLGDNETSWQVEPLSNGVLAVGTKAKVIEVDGDGQVIWQLKVAQLISFLPLRNGHYILSTRSPVDRVIEVTRDGIPVCESVPGFDVLRICRCLDLVAFGFVKARPKDLNIDSVAHQVHLLKRPEAPVRRKACALLKEHGGRAEVAIPDLLEAMGDTDEFVQDMAQEAMAAIGVKARRAVEAGLRSDRKQVRLGCLRYLASGYGSAKPPLSVLASLTTDDSAEVRAQALVVLGRIGRGAKSAVPSMIRALTDEDSKVRLSAAACLEALGPAAAEAVPALLERLKDKDLAVRGQVICTLGATKVKEKEVVQALTGCLAIDQPLFIRGCAASALADLGNAAKEAIPKLIEALETKIVKPEEENKRRLCSFAAFALGEIGPAAKAAVPNLVKLAANPQCDSVVRPNCVEALGKIGPAAAAAIPTLEKILKDRSPQPLSDPFCDVVEVALKKIRPAPR